MEPTMMQPVMTQAPTLSYAGFWKRFVAYFIDQLIVGFVGIIIAIPFLGGIIGLGVMSASSEDADSESLMGMIMALVAAYFFFIMCFVVLIWLYYALMESRKGGTLGKLAMGIRVTDMDGNMVTFGRATGRYFAKILSGLTFGIGYIIAGFTQQKQALHDIIAKTLVVNK